jgi:Amt family ammonium transporter
LIDVTVGLRVSGKDEKIGLDKSEHGTSAYPEFFGSEGDDEALASSEKGQGTVVTSTST